MGRFRTAQSASHRSTTNLGLENLSSVRDSAQRLPRHRLCDGQRSRSAAALRPGGLAMIGSLPVAAIAAARRSARLPVRPGAGQLDRHWALLNAVDVQRWWRGVGAGGSVGVLGVYQVEQRPQCPLRRPFMGPHHDLRGAHVDPTMSRCGNPGRGDSVEAPGGG